MCERLKATKAVHVYPMHWYILHIKITHLWRILVCTPSLCVILLFTVP